MRVFVTGATGFVGSAVTAELIAAGHQVLGLTRSEDGAQALAAAGAETHHGSLGDLDSLKAGAAAADGVIHLAFNHDFSNYVAVCEDDRRVIAALASALAGSDRPLLVTSGTGMGRGGEGHVISEDDPPIRSAEFARGASEEAAAAAVAQGVNAGIVRLPQVHDPERQGLFTYAVQVAREKGFAAYIGDGANRWAAAHISDTARLYRLALERAERGACYHAVGEEGVPIRAVAETIGRRLGLPTRSLTAEEAPGYFGWLAMFIGHNGRASSALTRQWLNWRPTGPGLLDDLARLPVGA